MFEIEIQPGQRRVHIIDGEVVVSSAADDEESVRAQVGSDSLKNGPSMLRDHEVQHVPDDKRAIEHRGLAERTEIQMDQIRNNPGRFRMLRSGGVNKNGVDVDPDDMMTERSEVPTVASWAAPGVQEPCSPWRKGIDQACLPVEIRSASRHVLEALYVPPRVRFVREARPAGTHRFFHSRVPSVGTHDVPGGAIRSAVEVCSSAFIRPACRIIA